MTIDTKAYEGDIVSRLKNWRGLHLAHSGGLFEEAADEIARLRGDAEVARLRLEAAQAEIDGLKDAIRRLAEQDATLSVQGGNVTVTMDATLTGEEKRAIRWASEMLEVGSLPNSLHRDDAATLRKLLERLNHDAVPEAIAGPCGKSDAQHPSAAKLPQPADQGLGTGNTQEPVAWARFYSNGGPESVYLDRPPADAVPLYRSPTLTDAEREAVKWAGGNEWWTDRNTPTGKRHAATMRGMLERLGGSNG